MAAAVRSACNAYLPHVISIIDKTISSAPSIEAKDTSRSDEKRRLMHAHQISSDLHEGASALNEIPTLLKFHCQYISINIMPSLISFQYAIGSKKRKQKMHLLFPIKI